MIARLARAAARRTRVLDADGLRDGDALTDLQAALFDLDGTLIDSESQVVAAAVEAIEGAGHSIDPDALMIAMGPPLTPVMQEMLAISAAEARSIYQEYLRIYMERYVPRTQPMPAAENLIDALRARDVHIAIVTNKVEEGGHAVVEMLHWESRIDLVVGADTAARAKPHAEPAQHALEFFGVAPQDAVFVGDSPADVGCAAAAGLRAGVGLVGSTDVDSLRAAGATHICADLLEVRALLVGA